MVKSFFKITMRNLMRNKLFVLINVSGLALSMACCIVAFINYKYSADFDRNHENYQELYKVHIRKEASGEFTPYGISPLPLVEAINSDISGINNAAKYHTEDFVLLRGEKVLTKRVAFADPEVFEMFTLPLKSGAIETFEGEKIALISETAAGIYFDDQDPIGEIISLVDNEGESHGFLIAGVLEDQPQNSSLTFDIIVNFNNYYTLKELERNDWTRWIAASFLQVDQGRSSKDIEKLLTSYIGVQNEARPDWKVSDYYLEPLATFGQTANEIYANWLNEAPDPVSYFAPLVLALMMLVIAGFNYTNTAIATSGKRLKEIGIRKVIGGNRGQLMLQFMFENLLICFIAILLSVVIAIYMVPAYGAMWNGMTLELNFTKDPEIYAFLFGLLIFTGLVAGAYPSVYVSKFEPVRILRGSLSLGKTSHLSKVLLTLQVAFTLMTLVTSASFIQNAKYQQSLDVGFVRENLLGVRVADGTEAKQLVNVISQNPNITDIQTSPYHVTYSVYAHTLITEERELETLMMTFTPGYLEFMNIDIVSGRSFDPDLVESERNSAIIINEKMAEKLGWDDPIGKRVTYNDTTRLTVIGMTENFYSSGFWDPVTPMAMRVADDEKAKFVLAKVPSSKSLETYAYLESAWLEAFPTSPFNGFYQEDRFKDEQMVNRNIVIIFSFLGLLAVLLSSVGLFTLVSLNIIRRMKEIGVRKVLGAQIPELITLLNRDFSWILIIGLVIGLGLGFVVTDFLIAQVFAYHLPINWISMVVPTVLILSILLFTSSGRIFVAARKNPVESLRYE
jgi:ABC-type antimicrobial peptide transport system permease subunit